MVGVVIVCHSAQAAAGIGEIARQMGPEVPLAAVGGTADGDIGTEPHSIREALESVLDSRGVLLLVDLGSAVMNAQMAIEMLEEQKRHLVAMGNAPVLEGAVAAVVQASLGSDLDEVRQAAEQAAQVDKFF